MLTEKDYVYWSIAQTLIAEKRFRLLHLSKTQNEMWLESPDSKDDTVFRIIKADIDWSNRMQRDMERVAGAAEQVRKQIKRRTMHVENVYVSQFEPVDDYEFRLKTPIRTGSKGQTTITSSLIAAAAGISDDHRMTERYGLSVEPHHLEEGEALDFRIQTMKQHVLKAASAQQDEDRKTFEVAKPFFTYVFIAIQLVMFYLLETNGGSMNSQTLIQYGAKFNPLIQEGEWWRFFTPIVLHIGALHLFMNTLALYFLGTLVERLYGRSRFLLIYIVSGFAGTVMSFVFSSSLSAGASGAIFGCFGALLYFGFRNPRLFFRTIGTNILVVIGINLVFGFTVPGIDNAGHLGGLLGGFLAAGIVHFPKQKKWGQQAIFAVASTIILGAALVIGYGGGFVQNDPATVNAFAQESIQSGEYDDARSNLQALQEEGEATAETYFLLSIIDFEEDRLEDAETNLLEAVDLRPAFPEAFYNLAIVTYRLTGPEEALGYAEEALELEPDNEQYQSLLEDLRAEAQ